MKKVAFILLISIPLFVSAQQAQKKESIYFQGGAVNEGGIDTSFGTEKFFGKKEDNSIFLSFNYQNLAIYDADQQNYFISLGYRKYLFAKNTNKLYPYVGIGGIIGVESRKTEFDYKSEKDFLFGGKAHIGLEYRIGSVVPFIEAAYMYTHSQYGLGNIGLKYYF